MEAPNFWLLKGLEKIVLLIREMSIPPRLPTEVWDLIHKINTTKAKFEVNRELVGRGK